MRPMTDMDWLFDWMWPIMAASVIVPLVITGVVIATVIWAIRRNSAPQEDPAVAALKARYARGEIDQAEFEVRLRSLTRDRD
jgi:putative membrane protein